ncbi:ArsS family sensor histidine kinase [Arcobacter sp. FWKO B]|uniref:ArsS family sensor histidine kinase n=1 Tax=Arcobacter sp. FWKO B TaxID=2593672 RepID=UPI0018A665CF|nr:ArsS family sensor histidine kinase [Arcobacter sp. FWKO B]QOG12115.1 HAMP domain-containing histidine kinase [Arcobacter sp. FWKO B]
MKKDSIFFTLGVTFLVSLSILVISFFVLITSNYNQKIQNLEHKYFGITKMVNNECRKRGITQELIQHLEAMNLEIIPDQKNIENIISSNDTKLIFHKMHRAFEFRLLEHGGFYYLYFMTPRESSLLIKDNDTQIDSSHLYIMTIFAMIFFALVLSALATLKKLYPLKILKNKVQSLGDEEFDFECCNTKSKDEVSLLAQEFKKSANKLKKLKESRNVFIRNIMHELKTPITKGKFLVELDNAKKEDFAKVFYRLESLINEFASIEEVIATKNKIEKKEYFLSDIIDNAVDLLYIDDDRIEINITDTKLKVNFKLFSIAIKNLLDNGIKYSPDAKVQISNDIEAIIISNNSEPLKYELKEYFEPFFKDKEQIESFGLGLYITKHLLDANGYSLEYEHIDGKNIFKVKSK